MGLEDLCLLKQLPDAQTFVQKVFRGYADYTMDIAQYRKAKDELFQRVCG